MANPFTAIYRKTERYVLSPILDPHHANLYFDIDDHKNQFARFKNKATKMAPDGFNLIVFGPSGAGKKSFGNRAAFELLGVLNGNQYRAASVVLPELSSFGQAEQVAFMTKAASICHTDLAHDEQLVLMHQNLTDFARSLADKLAQRKEQLIIVVGEAPLTVQKECITAFNRPQYHLILKASTKESTHELNRHCGTVHRIAHVAELGQLNASDVRLYVENILVKAGPFYEFTDISMTPDFVNEFVSEFEKATALVSLSRVRHILEKVVLFCLEKDATILTPDLYNEFLINAGKDSLHG